MANGQDTPFPITPGQIIPMPLSSGATDQPAAPQPRTSAQNPPSSDILFPLLSKSKGFKEAMKASEDAGEEGPPESTLPRSVIMQRNMTKMEDSDFYKESDGAGRVRLQTAFYKRFVEPLARRDQNPVTLQDWLKARSQKWLETHPNTKALYTDPTKVQMAASHAALRIAASPVDAYNAIKQKFQDIKEAYGAASATFDATVLPHMGPVLLTPEHLEVKKLDPKVPGTGMTLDEMYKTSKFVQENYYQNTTRDKVLRGSGEIIGTLPAIYAGGGILEELGVSDLLGLEARTATKGIAGPVGKTMMGRASGFALEAGKRSIYAGAQGYLLGKSEREGKPIHEALNFAIGEALLAAPTKFLGKIATWGGQKLLRDTTEKAVADYIAKTPDTQTTSAAVAMAGSQKQKITRAVINAINDQTGGKFWTYPRDAQRGVLKQIAVKFPELAKEAGMIDKHITELQALQNMALWRDAMPEADKVLKSLEALDGKPTTKTIADNVAAREQAEKMRSSSDRFMAEALKSPEVQNLINKDIVGSEGVTVPGAASAKSLEFGDNFTKHVDTRLTKLGLGRDKYTWESRGHKFLFYLNVLASETKEHGPSAFRDKESQLAMHQLSQEFPGKNMEELLLMSDLLWVKIKNLEKAGEVKPGVPTKIWRQTHLGTGESPFAHEIDLLQKAAKADAAKAEAKPQTDDEKLASAFKKHGDTGTTAVDKGIHNEVMERMFPGQKYENLTPDEQSEVNQTAAKISKARGKK